MKFNIVTLFPESFSYLNQSILSRAQKNGILEIKIYNLRDWAKDKYKTVDDKPFGGGAGMLIKVDVVYFSLKSLGLLNRTESSKIILTSAKGKIWKQKDAVHFSDKKYSELTILCGHYEGFDERILEFVDYEYSIGEYVLSGGELPAMVIIDSIARNLPGVLGNEASLESESFKNLDDKEYPQYTRPATFVTEEGVELNVPEILLSGNHREIDKWRHSKSE